ncbi:unnamed protein product [Mytilus edulis]|uniref:Uncharacterized protein n=1 Tax=Mytilus edulis TaxID=6550 RepID=A0A8S3Q5L7_MYTED|nr:unnamed protein product [Mytilus edulis]
MSRKLEKYIADQPQFPPGFQHKTAILVSDSKGYTLRNNCLQKEFPLETWCKSGATTEVLVNLIKTRIAKAIKRHHHIIIYLWSGTCDLTTKEGKYIKLKFHNNRAIKIIEDQYKRAISIIDSYQHAEIKFIDCPLISISNWNKSKGHKRPETYKVEDFLATKQIQELNGKIYELNRRLNKTSVKISKYFFRGRKRRKGQTRKSVNLSINNKDGIHPGRLLSLAITKNILLDTYTECFNIDQESEFIQIRVEQEELNSLF